MAETYLGNIVLRAYAARRAADTLGMVREWASERHPAPLSVAFAATNFAEFEIIEKPVPKREQARLDEIAGLSKPD